MKYTPEIRPAEIPSVWVNASVQKSNIDAIAKRDFVVS